MEFPEDFKYSKDHEWISTEGSKGKIGVTKYAIEQLGDIVHVDLPSPGEEYEAGASFGTIESTKTVSDLYMPVSGKIVQINEDVVDTPESLQEDPYNKGWLIIVEVTDSSEELLSASQYDSFIKED